MRPAHVNLECPLCHVTQPVEVEYDDDGNGSAALDTVPCADDRCTAKLCPECPRFVCGGCDLTFCDGHDSFADEGYCPACVAIFEADALELAEQETALRLSVMAQAGCTLAEVRAVERGGVA